MAKLQFVEEYKGLTIKKYTDPSYVDGFWAIRPGGSPFYPRMKDEDEEGTWWKSISRLKSAWDDALSKIERKKIVRDRLLAIKPQVDEINYELKNHHLIISNLVTTRKKLLQEARKL